MDELLQAKYTDFTNEDVDYPSVTSIKKTGYMPVPRPTIASQSMIVARERQQEEVSVHTCNLCSISLTTIPKCYFYCSNIRNISS